MQQHSRRCFVVYCAQAYHFMSSLLCTPIMGIYITYIIISPCAIAFVVLLFSALCKESVKWAHDTLHLTKGCTTKFNRMFDVIWSNIYISRWKRCLAKTGRRAYSTCSCGSQRPSWLSSTPWRTKKHFFSKLRKGSSMTDKRGEINLRHFPTWTPALWLWQPMVFYTL